MKLLFKQDYESKYCKCDISHFTFEVDKENNKIKIFHKKVLFYSLNDKEIEEYNKLNKEKQLLFLNCNWNFYMAIND